MKILFLTRSLNLGGAERQLIILAHGLNNRGHNVRVAEFYSHGPLENDLVDACIPLTRLEKRGRWDVIQFMWRLISTVHQEKPELVLSYLTVPNIATIFLKLFFPRITMVWGVRASNLDYDHYDWLTRLTFNIECLLSRYADIIIVNSNAGRNYHMLHGFPGDRMVVIPNGIDTMKFSPDVHKRSRIRANWHLNEHEIVIGMAGRLDPMKDHPTFLNAAFFLSKIMDNLRFVIIGDGPEAYKNKLIRMSDELGLKQKTLWVGSQTDMPAVLNALDIFVSSSSFGEGFSNVIGEAMACGIPCVVTDVGDSSWIVCDTGSVVPPREPKLLSKALLQTIERINTIDRSVLRNACRERILSKFTVNNLIINSERILMNDTMDT